MQKRQMVADIQQALMQAGYRITKAEIGSAFRTKKGCFSKTLYGVWMHCHHMPTVLSALRHRGAQPEDNRIAKPSVKKKPKTKQKIRVNLSSAEILSVCPYCGYPDPQYGQATHCPNCDLGY